MNKHYSKIDYVYGSTVESSERAVSFSFAVRIILLFVIGIPCIQFLFIDHVTLFNLDSILSMLSGAPLIDLSWISDIGSIGIPMITTEWTGFEWLRSFLNTLIDTINFQFQAISFIAWIGAGLVNCVLFIAHFYVSIFGV